MVPNLFGTRDWFCGRQFFPRLGMEGWFADDSSELHLLCTLFLLLLHQLHIRSSGIRSWRLGTRPLHPSRPAIGRYILICSLKEYHSAVEMVTRITIWIILTNLQFSSVAQSCPSIFDPMNCSTPGLPVHHQLPEFTQTHVHRAGDAIQPSHPLSSSSPPAPNPSQHHKPLVQFSSVQSLSHVRFFVTP